MRRWLGSVRVRTTLAATAALGIALAIGAVVLVQVLERSLVVSLQNSLEVRAAEIASMARSGKLPGRLTLVGQAVSFVRVVDASGRIVSAGDNFQGTGPTVGFHAPQSPPAAWSQRLTADDELYRVVSVSTSTASGPVTIYAASSLEKASDSVTRVETELAVGLPILLLVLAVTCWITVGRALRPVEAIRGQVAEIGSQALDRRVPEPALRDEVGRLARTMNAMLDRLQTASDKQQRFVADASHELRSPLASLRAQLEVKQAYAPDKAGGEISDLLAEVDRMERLVDDLLLLARADEHTLARTFEPVRFDAVVREEAARVVSRHRVRLDISAVEEATLVGDRDGLGRVLRNLLENAERHAASSVSIGLSKMDGRVELTVADDGPGIPASVRERVFERFTRLDRDRARGTGGAGLGLSIAREIVAAHGGLISVADTTSGACLIVHLPSAGPARRR